MKDLGAGSHFRRYKLEIFRLKARTREDIVEGIFLMDLMTGWLMELLMMYQGKQEQENNR